ncbi:MAG: signal peptidase I, partial [Burkholderia sp.]|nr:signal peptidase I [Burkholderia sp.]
MNFALILFVLVVVTGVAWVLDKLVFLPQRRKAADSAIEEFDRQQSRIDKRFADENAVQTRSKLRDEKLRQPWWLEYTASFFPVILAVFVVRSFVVEPFKIPSGSMVPTLLVGDFILVNKFEYGLRLPVTNTKITQGSPLSRGDVVVFRYPKDESVDYIKRVIGLPGDTIQMRHGQVILNGTLVPKVRIADFTMPLSPNYPAIKECPSEYEDSVKGVTVCRYQQFRETLPNGKSYAVLDRGEQAGDNTGIYFVPAGHVFVMGDNRDNSADSRYPAPHDALPGQSSGMG